MSMRSTIAAALSLLVTSAACARAAPPVERAEIAHDHQSFEDIERGRYLATLADCTACHTEPGGKPYAGGRAIETPFGNLLAPNITPDIETGIGSWADDDFVNALQVGRSHGGTRLYPAMPYPYYTKMAREDILAIRAYLDALEPVYHPVHSNQLPFPFDIRASMIGWNWLFFTPGRFEPAAGKSDEWNRGAYLVQGPGHCGACHTEKNFLGGDKNSEALQGGTLQGWFSPNVTGNPRQGLGSWSVDDVVAYLKTGQNRIGAATGPMAEVISDSTSHLTDADLKAIAVYLKDQPSPPAPTTAMAADDPAMKAGQAIYKDQCAACHRDDGTGVPRIFPAMKGNPDVQSANPTTLIRVVLHGTQNVATPYAPTGAAMPSFFWKLTDMQVASVLTYVRNSWGNVAPAVSARDVSSGRAQQLSQGVP
ncbi:MAG TPA: cytochrome c [Alphaproteobacteria bacterium]|nr:cytochrome c [Alphaproteobacteria bacterium]